jgi:hypothetical protein
LCLKADDFALHEMRQDYFISVTSSFDSLSTLMASRGALAIHILCPFQSCIKLQFEASYRIDTVPAQPIVLPLMRKRINSVAIMY